MQKCANYPYAYFKLLMVFLFVFFFLPNSGFAQPKRLNSAFKKPYQKLISTKYLKVIKKRNDQKIITNITGIPLLLKFSDRKGTSEKMLYPGEELTLTLSAEKPTATVSLSFPEVYYSRLLRNAEEILDLLLKGRRVDEVELIQKIRAYKLERRLLSPVPGLPIVNLTVYIHFLNEAYYNPQNLPKIFLGGSYTFNYKKPKPYTPYVFLDAKIKYSPFVLNDALGFIGFFDVGAGLLLTPEMNVLKNKWRTRFYAVGGRQYTGNVTGLRNSMDSIVIDKDFVVSNNYLTIPENEVINMESVQYTAGIKIRKAKNHVFSFDLDIGTVIHRKSTVFINATENVLTATSFSDAFEKPDWKKNGYVNLSINGRFAKKSKNNRIYGGYHGNGMLSNFGFTFFAGVMQYEQTPNENFPFLNSNLTQLTLESEKRFIWSGGAGLTFLIP